MGFFQKKEKNRPPPPPEEVPAASNPTQSEDFLSPPRASQPPPTSTNTSYDSTYQSMSDVSTNPPHQTTRPPNQAPGTTVTTTTTTTTTTTVVTMDGTAYTQTHPYNPATDPPPQVSETTVNLPLPSNGEAKGAISSPGPSQSATPAPDLLHPAQQRPDYTRKQSPARKPSPLQTYTNNAPYSNGHQQSDYLSAVPSSPVTSGGRAIPPRSELRDTTPPKTYSQLYDPTISGPESPYGEVPPRSEKRTSREYLVQPLNIASRKSMDEGTQPPNQSSNTVPDNGPANVYSGESSLPSEPHFKETQGTAQPPIRPEPQVQQAPLSKRQSLSTTLRGIHGAGEVLRGSLNSKIAHASHNAEEEARMRAVREQGMQDFRTSGLYDKTGLGKEKVEGGRRLRKRSLSRGPQLGHSLDVVDERPTP